MLLHSKCFNVVLLVNSYIPVTVSSRDSLVTDVWNLSSSMFHVIASEGCQLLILLETLEGELKHTL